MAKREVVREIESQAGQLRVKNTVALRTLRREYSKRIAAMPAADVIAIAVKLIERGRVPRFFADELIASHDGALRSMNLRTLERLGSAMSSWADVDSFACYLSGPAWREGCVTDAAVQRWAKSKDRWWRRAALVSTVPLNVKARGGSGDARRTLRICRLLLDDRNPMVVKALSWALRALVGRDAPAVRAFIRKNESRLPALVRREVSRKLATGRKSPRVTR